MPNPWLSIPLSDYEGHMESPGVQQLSALSQFFARVLQECRPRSVAVLGVAGGNGLEHIPRTSVERLVGVDINPDYLKELSQRYKDVAALEVHCVDIATERVPAQPVDVVHAALIFEHTGLGPALESAVALIAPGGRLSVVLQLPGSEHDVAPTPFPSIQTLRDHFTLIDPADLRTELLAAGFHLVDEARRAIPAGKALWLGVFARASA